jgi:hypothetical protein
LEARANVFAKELRLFPSGNRKRAHAKRDGDVLDIEEPFSTKEMVKFLEG